VSFLAASQYIAHFAFPEGTVAADVTVTWPDGHVQALVGVATGETHTIVRE
jgi:hypothetical protein